MDLEELYKAVYEEVHNRAFSEYENVFIFAKTFLQYYVKLWCNGDYILKSGNHYEDVLEEICIHITKKCDKFFFNNQGEKNCENFKAWCYTVARNYFNSYYKRVKKDAEDNADYIKKESKKIPIDSDAIEDVVDRQEALEVNRIELSNVFSIVFNLKTKPHIALTWLSVTMFMLVKNCSKIEATHATVAAFSECSLFKMLDIIIATIKKYKWLEVNDYSINMQYAKLQQAHQETSKLIGDMKYSEFYMKKGAEMSISDWLNRVNEQIVKKMTRG